MKYEISKGNYPVVSLTLSAGEKIFVPYKKARIRWKSENIVKNIISKGKQKPFIEIALFRKDNVFEIYSAIEKEEIIALSTTDLAEIKPIIIKKNQSLIIRKNSLIATTENIKITPHLKLNFLRKFFWSEMIALDKVEGEGIVFIEVGSSAIEYKLEEKQKIVFTDSVISIMENTCRVEIQQINIFKTLLHGNRIYRYSVTGPGKVTLQPLSD
jgi:uncharacterized protein (AIM24 family)